MNIKFSRIFRKQFKKLSVKNKQVFKTKIILFQNDPFDYLLNNHSLRGQYRQCRSINITGNIRAIYGVADNKIISFIAIGTHNELYE